MGEHMYWAGGIIDCKVRHYSSSMILYRHNLTNPTPSSWEIVSFSKKLHRYEPCVVSLDRKIYVLGGQYRSHEGGKDEGRQCGEVYDVDTQTWDLCALNVQEFASFTNSNTVLMTNKEGEAIVICYSILTGHLLFYNVREDDFKFEVHPHFNFGKRPSCYYIPNGLDGLDHDEFDQLMYVATNYRSVASDSMLYWFIPFDLRLYGYDFSEQRWFKSKSLEENFEWKLREEFEPIMKSYHRTPVLVDLYNGNFFVIAPLYSEKMGVAVLAVSKCADSLVMSVELCRILSAVPCFTPLDGMAMEK